MANYAPLDDNRYPTNSAYTYDIQNIIEAMNSFLPHYIPDIKHRRRSS